MMRSAMRSTVRLPAARAVLPAARAMCVASRSQDSTASATKDHSFLSDDRIRVGPDYNRWHQLVPACAAGVGIGTYASVPAVLGPLVCRAQGVVAQAPSDFAMSDLLPVATMMPLVAGIAAAGAAATGGRDLHRPRCQDRAGDAGALFNYNFQLGTPE